MFTPESIRHHHMSTPPSIYIRLLSRLLMQAFLYTSGQTDHTILQESDKIRLLDFVTLSLFTSSMWHRNYREEPVILEHWRWWVGMRIPCLSLQLILLGRWIKYRTAWIETGEMISASLERSFVIP